MGSKWAFGAIAISIVLGFGQSASAAPDGAKARRAGAVLYQVKPALNDAQSAALATVKEKHQLKEDKALLQGIVHLAKSHAAKPADEESISAELQASGAVIFAEPDYLFEPIAIPNDPIYVSQWQYPKINAPAAWDITTGSSSIIVAVCDTGVEATHPDLAANLMLPGYNSVDGSTNTSPINWHGTGTAGCVGAVGNNGTGVCGSAWTVKILPVRVSNISSGSAYTSDLYDGLIWAADHGARVVNMSYGVAGSATIDSGAQYLRGKGGLLFVSAGNSGKNEGFTAYSSFISVSATNSSDALASWSSYGSYVDIAAPGESIVTTYTGGSTATVSGTSFSSPISAGVAALIFSVNPSFTPAQVEDIIFTTSKDLGATGKDISFGYGRIDAGAAVAKAAASVGNKPPVAAASASPETGNMPLSVNFYATGSSDPDGTIASYAWSFGDGASATGDTATHTYNAAGAYTATLTVTDDKGSTGTDTVAITVVDGSVVNAPTSLTGSASRQRVVTLNWTDQSSNETGFEIERGIKSKNATTWQRVGTTGANATTWSQTVSSGTYSYRVRAVNSATGRTSAYSNTVQVRVR